LSRQAAQQKQISSKIDDDASNVEAVQKKSPGKERKSRNRESAWVFYAPN
jgi:hypothetical protein